MNYSELSGVLMGEKRSPQLQSLNPLFFEDVQSLVEEYDKRLNENFDVDLERSLKNLQRKFEELQLVRLKKIFLQALSDFQLNKTSFEGMSDKERDLYLSLIDYVKKYFNKISKPSTLKLKVLAQIPKFVGLSGREYGPFEEGSVAELDSVDAELLISRSVAKQA